jgi:hypothetical protein
MTFLSLFRVLLSWFTNGPAQSFNDGTIISIHPSRGSGALLEMHFHQKAGYDV